MSEPTKSGQIKASQSASYPDDVKVTDAMIERGGRALCDWDNERERQRNDGIRKAYLTYEDWRDEYDSRARAAIIAALEMS